MSRETAAEIHITLDALKAPPNASIAERIRGLVGPAAAALHEAGFAVGDGTLAECVTEALADAKAARHMLSAHVVSNGPLADAVSRLIDLRTWSIAQRDEQVKARMDAQKAQAAAEGLQETIAMERDTYAARWRASEKEAAEASAELVRLRADVARLSAQLDYATELCLAGFRQ